MTVRGRLRMMRLLLALACLATVSVPFVIENKFFLDLLVVIALFAVAGMSYDLLVGYAGQFSFAHAGFFALGAYATGISTTSYGLPPLAGVAISVVLCALASLGLGTIVLRLHGLSFAIATLAFTLIVQTLLVAMRDLTGGSLGLVGIPHFSVGAIVFSEVQHYYWLAWSLVIVVLWAGRNVVRSHVGRAYKALHVDEDAAASLGINVFWRKMEVFIVSAAVAGLAGAVLAHHAQYVSPQIAGVVTIVEFLLIITLGGVGTLGGAILGAAVIKVLPHFIQALADFQSLIYGVTLLALLIWLPRGILGTINAALGPRNARTTRAERCENSDVNAPPGRRRGYRPTTPPEAVRAADGEPILSIERISKRFGGVQAVQDVSFVVPRGRITALVGPNGAGKTTLFDAITRVQKADQGFVDYGGKLLNEMPPHEIARSGLLRTFQGVRLFQNMSVVENVMVGSHARRSYQLGRTAAAMPEARSAEAAMKRDAMGWLAFLKLQDLAEMPAAELTTGQQRLVSVARALQSSPDVVLLDEPAGGLGDRETEELGNVLLSLLDMGVTVLLVEHNMGLVMRVAHEIIVMNFGRIIAQGPPQAIGANEEVQAAYLGGTRA